MMGIVVEKCEVAKGDPSACWEMDALVKPRLFLRVQEEEGKEGNGT